MRIHKATRGMMSLRRWLTSSSSEDTTPSFLPRGDSGSCTDAANKVVVKAMETESKRKRGEYHHYSVELWAKVAKYTCEFGNKAAVNKYSTELGYTVSEATVRNFKRAYLERLKSTPDPDTITSLPTAAHGRPLLIGRFGDDVYDYITRLRQSGGVVNSTILIAAAKGIITHKNSSHLKEYGGSVELEKKWAESFLLQRGFVRRKATKAARKLPPDYGTIKEVFLTRIHDEVTSNTIPPQLIVNWDQTGVKLVPVSSWTMEKEGTKQVAVVGKDDKREITALLAARASGNLLPPQLIYQGNTTSCHPKVTFPGKWNVTHSDNHWSNEKTMLEYLDCVIIPYVVETRNALDLPEDQPALCIFDVFAAHRCSTVLGKLQSNNIHQVFIPAGCTGELQPLDVGVNDRFKNLMKNSFSRWYATEVKEAMDCGVNISEIKIDLKASLMKPLNANWIITAITTLSESTELIRKPFQTVGIIS